MHLNTNIWFNHSFSTTYNTIQQLRRALRAARLKEVSILASNTDINSVYSGVCDAFYVEPSEISEEDYVKYALKFCKEHSIRVMFPTRYREILAKHLEKFRKIGTEVLVQDNAELLEMLENKQKCMNMLKESGLCKIHPFEVVHNLSEFNESCNKLKTLSEPFDDCKLCMKFNQDVGATSFRVIDNTKSSILDKVSDDKPLLVMPYLEGIEVSIDSYMGKDTFFAITRYKLGGRRTLVEWNEEFYNLSKKVAEFFGITGLYNLQLKGHRGNWYFLEINTRMAGGIHKTVTAGVNIPYIAYKDVIGLSVKADEKELKSNFGKRVHLSQIETPVMLDTTTISEKDEENIKLSL